MRKFIFILILLPFFAQAQMRFLPVSADYSVFQMNDSLAYVEFYLSFFQANLQYKQQHDSLVANFESSVVIKYNDEVVKNITHKFTNTITDTSKMSAYNLFNDIFALGLPFKLYNVTVKLLDTNSGVTGEFVMEVPVPGPQDAFYLSNIEFASNIQKAESQTKFVKNGLNIMPYPRKVFDMLQPMLFYYVELNNLSKSETQENTFQINYFVTNEFGDTLKTGKSKTKKVRGKVQADIGAFNALSLPKGTYYLNINALDMASNISSSIKKKFGVHKQSKEETETASALDKIDPVFLSYTEEELRVEAKMADYIASNDEQEVFARLDSSNALRTYLTSFWRKRDRQTNSPYGSSRRKFLDLCAMANSEYGSSMTPGWKTDQGRILITYGMPNEIERFTSSLETKPYVVWKYHELEGGSEFIFYDRNGFGKYELIHSTYYKELSNPDWQRLISNSGN